ncbi:MAG: O-antigen ligase family protein [Thermoplasmata archaeon]|nr:O-antigen ligase family protein [Thermoplasmata archaeon]
MIKSRYRPRKEIVLLYFLIVAMPFFSFPPFCVSTNATTVFRIDWAVGALLVLVFLGEVLLGKQKVKINRVGKAVLALNVIAILTLFDLFNTGTFHSAFSSLYNFATLEFQLIFATLLFFAISNLDVSKGELKRILQVWVGTAFLISLYGIYQTFARNFGLPGGYIGGLTHGYGPSGFAGFIRPSAFFREASWFGNYLIAPIILTTLAVYYKKSHMLFQRNSRNILALSVLITGFFLSFSLAAYAILDGIVTLSLLNRYLRGRTVKTALIFLVAIIGTSFLLQYSGIDFIHIVAERVKGVYYDIFQPSKAISSPAAKNSFNIRFARIIMGLRVWLDHPLLGVGLNNYSFYGIEYGGVQFWTTDSFWVQSLAEGGILFLGALVFVHVLALTQLKRYIRKAHGNDQFLYTTGTAFYYIIWAQVLSGFLTYSWISMFWWVNLSLACLVMYTAKGFTVSKARQE